MTKPRKCSGQDCKNKPFDERNDAEEEHGCPYSEEIGDGSVRCTCCQDCRLECLHDI